MPGADAGPDAGRWLRARAGRVHGPTGGAVACGVVDALLILAQALLIAWIVQRSVVDGAPPGTLVIPFSALAAVLLLRAGATALRARFAAQVGAWITQDVRAELFDAITARGPVALRAHPSGAVTTALVDQVHALEAYYAHYRPQAVLALAVPLILIAVVFALDWLAGALLLLAVPLAPLFMSLIGIGAEHLAQGQHQAQARISAHFLDRLRGVTTLRLFRAGDAAADAVGAAAEHYRRSSMKVLRVAFLSSAALELIAAISIAVVAVYIGFSLLGYLDFGPGDDLTLFGGLAILLLAPEVFLPLRRFAQHYHDRADALGAAEELARLAGSSAHRRSEPVDPLSGSQSAAPHDAPPAAPVARHRHGVSVHLTGVRFQYPEAQTPVLDGVELAAAPGERVILTGPSGGGKSTLLALIAGFVSPDAGSVLVDGRTAPGGVAIGWVGQSPWLFHGTLADNLRLAAPDADDDALWRVLEAVDLADAVGALPNALATPLGENGYGLSGGQARRLAIARAMLADAPLLLLDEPTAGLDEDAAARVLAALEQAATRRCTVVTAMHDPAGARWAERTVRIEGGRVHA